MKNKQQALDKRIKIADVLKSVREEKGMSIEEVAEQVGISKNTLQRIEAGRFSPDADLLCVIVNALGGDLKINDEII